MNWEHFQTLLWVRWRLTANHIRCHGALNSVILTIAGGMALIGSVLGFFFAIGAGMMFLPETQPAVLMYVCDAWVLAFLFFWMIGVMTDLQRGEMLSLDKLLHLPTTLAEVFLFNFLSSLLALTTLTFIPPMLGLCVAAVLTRGPAALVMFPLVATFVLMVCAVTYQFRGWLATLMTNKRRRRTVMVVVMFLFILTLQTPQLIGYAVQRQMANSRSEEIRQHESLTVKFKAGQISAETLQQELDAARSARHETALAEFERVAFILNVVLPVGWPACGASAAAAGNPWPGLAGVLGMASIAWISLRRSYRTTLRYFTGDSNGRRPRSVAAKSVVSSTRTATGRSKLIEWSFPLVPEPSAAVASATFCSLLRAPEVKLALLGPLIMLIVFGAVLPSWLTDDASAGAWKSVAPLGVMGLSLLGLAQFFQNLFAFDRSGFRAYVLSGVPRSQILLGKNLSLAPLAVGPAYLLMTLTQFLVPAPIEHFAAALLEVPTVYLVLCLMGNSTSIHCPIGYAPGSMKPANASGISLLLQFVLGLVMIATLGVVAIIPLGIEWLATRHTWLPASVPVAIIVAAGELAAAVLCYRFFIRRQGTELQAREGRILEAVVEKGE